MQTLKKKVSAAALGFETGLFVFPSDERDLLIVARHYGIDGKGGANFSRTGTEFGLTRERVRQIVAETDPRQYLIPEALARLRQIIGAITANLPAPAARVEARLQAEGLTSNVFRLEGIIAMAALLDVPVPFRVRPVNGERFAVAADTPPFQEIVVKARRIVRRNGMATVAECLVGKSKSGATQRDLDIAEAVLSARSDFRWLTRQSGWFWFSDTARNRIASRIEKMLAVANPLGIAEIRAGLARMGGPLAPDHVLLEFCGQLPDISVRNDTVRADKEISLTEVLNQTERDMFRLLSEHDGVMSRSDLIYRSNLLGIKRPTFYQCVTQSPILARYNRTQYRLIGSGSPEQTVPAPRSRSRVLPIPVSAPQLSTHG